MAEMQSRITRGETTIEVPCNDKYVSFVHPSSAPNNYRNAFAEVIAKGLKPANGDEMASLLYLAYCELPNEPESKDIKGIMRSRWLWVANRNIWTSQGVYVIQDEKGQGRNAEFYINQLEKAVKNAEVINDVRFSKDRKVRFAPRKTYESGEQTADEFAKNGFIIASYGKEGAEKLKEVAKTFSYKPHVWTLDTSTPEQRVSALCGYGGGLVACGVKFDVIDNGRAFGVRVK